MTRDGRGGIKWIHEDRIFQNRNSTGDPVLQHDDCHTWASRLTSPAGKTMVINGRNEERQFTLDELLSRLDSYLETTMSRRRALISLVVIASSFEEVMALYPDADTNQIYQ